MDIYGYEYVCVCLCIDVWMFTYDTMDAMEMNMYA